MHACMCASTADGGKVPCVINVTAALLECITHAARLPPLPPLPTAPAQTPQALRLTSETRAQPT